jgi:hypothetical protein
MTKKELYTSPEVDVFLVQTEGVICQSSGEIGVPNWDDGLDDWWLDPPFFL